MIFTIDMMKNTYDIKWLRVVTTTLFFNNKNNFEKSVDNIVWQYYYINIKLINNFFKK